MADESRPTEPSRSAGDPDDTDRSSYDRAADLVAENVDLAAAGLGELE